MGNSVKVLQSDTSPLASRRSLDLAIPSPPFIGVERGNLGGTWSDGFTVPKASGRHWWND